MVIDGIEYNSDLIIFPNKIDSNWWRLDGHLMQPQDLKTIDLDLIEMIIVGQGMPGLMKVSEETKDLLKQKNITLYVSNSAKATQKYNETIDKSRTVAVFHLTC